MNIYAIIFRSLFLFIYMFGSLVFADTHANLIDDQQQYQKELKKKLDVVQNQRSEDASKKYNFFLSYAPFAYDNKAFNKRLQTAFLDNNFESLFTILKDESLTISQKSNHQYRIFVHPYQPKNSAYKIAKAILDKSPDDLAAAFESLDSSLETNVFVDDEFGNPLIYLAITKQNEDAVKRLLDAGVNANIMGPDTQSTPLAEAMYVKNFTIVDLLLNAGADVDTILIGEKNRPTLLSYSASTGNTKLLTQLLLLGADADIGDHFGWTPLMETIHTQNWELFELLLPVSDPNIRSTKEIEAGTHRKPFDRSYPLCDALFIAEQIDSPLGDKFRKAIQARLEK